MARLPRIPLSQAIDEYLEWLELDRHAAPGTVAEYRRDLDAFQDWAGGDEGVPAISRLDRDTLRGYQRRLARLRTGAQGSKRPLAPSTRARRLVALRSFLRFCAREEWLPGDLGATIDVPKLPERLPKPVDAGARDRLLDDLPTGCLEDLRDRALILFLLSTGCRISEALRLDVEDWNPRRMTVIGKGDRERTVTITEKARAAVEEYLRERDDASPPSSSASSPPPVARRRTGSPPTGLATCAVSSPCGSASRRSGPTSCATRWGHCC